MRLLIPLLLAGLALAQNRLPIYDGQKYIYPQTTCVITGQSPSDPYCKNCSIDCGLTNLATTGSGAPTANCTPGTTPDYIDTASPNKDRYYCSATNAWTKYGSSSGAAIDTVNATQGVSAGISGGHILNLQGDCTYVGCLGVQNVWGAAQSFTGPLDASGAPHTYPFQVKTSNPSGACVTNEWAAVPSSTSVWWCPSGTWTQFSSGGGGTVVAAAAYTTTTSAQTGTITHSLNYQYVQIAAYDTSTGQRLWPAVNPSAANSFAYDLGSTRNVAWTVLTGSPIVYTWSVSASSTSSVTGATHGRGHAPAINCYRTSDGARLLPAVAMNTSTYDFSLDFGSSTTAACSAI
jgi:hypothetical protein